MTSAGPRSSSSVGSRDMTDLPDVPRIVATLQAFLEGSEALRAVLLLDRGEGEPLVIDCLLDGTAELLEGGDVRAVAEGEWVDVRPLGPLPDLRAFAPLEIDLSAATVTAPLGAFDFVARAVRDTAALFPGVSVLTVGFESTDPDRPLFLAARRDEPMVASLGDDEYELPPGWPPA